MPKVPIISVGAILRDTIVPVFMARQPIYDAHRQVVGYELLYRQAPNSESTQDLSEIEAARALTNALVDIGLNELVGGSKAFINVSEQMILAQAIDAFPTQRVVVEVLEHVRPTEDVLDEVRRLKRLGYQLALDDFVWSEQSTPLLPFADIVKIDIADVGFDRLPQMVRDLREFPVILLAERVETHEEQAACLDLGFDLFQGFYMAKPQTVEGRSLRSNHLALVRLISRLNAPDITLDELEELVAGDVQLDVKLLKLIKSAYFGLPPKVDSIRKALLFIGVNTLAAIATLLMMSQCPDKPQELVFTAMVRARMADRIGAHFGHRDTDRHFTVGMLSVLDALMDLPMQELLRELPLSDDVEEALVNGACDNEMAHSLRVIHAFERGDFAGLAAENMPIDVASSVYREALGWASHTQAALAA